MSDDEPRFNSKDEFYEWAKKNWPADTQFCAKHWAPFALREIEGGVVFSIMYITDFLAFDTDLAKRAKGDRNLAFKLASPLCCHYGEEVYEKMLAEIQAPQEWSYECQLDPRPGGSQRKCRGVLHDKCKEAREARSL